MRTNAVERKALCILLGVKEDDLGYFLASPVGMKQARLKLSQEAGKRVLTTKGKKFVKKLESKLQPGIG